MRRAMLSVAGAVLAAIVLLAPAAAQADEAEYKVMVFSVKGTNGFTLKAVSSPPPQGPEAAVEEEESEGFGSLGLWLEHGRREGVTYGIAEARVTATTIEVELPGIVKISLKRVPTGRHKTLHVNCPSGQKLRGKTSLDRFVGTIEFHGEEGFSEVKASSAGGSYGPYCGIPEGAVPAGKKLPGAYLSVHHEVGDTYSATFGALRPRPDAKTAIDAEVMETLGETEVHRFREVFAPAGAFSFDPKLQAATVKPPAPFSGSAHFAARPGGDENAIGTWTGDLAVDLPGHAGIPLTGRGFRATLFHPTQ